MEKAMKWILTVLVALAVLAPVQAQAVPDPGILPDNPLWNVKIVWEKVQVFVAKDGTQKARLRMELAERRVAEAQALTDTGRATPDAMNKARNRYKELVEAVESEDLPAMDRTTDPAKALEAHKEKEKIRLRLEAHSMQIAQLRSHLDTLNLPPQARENMERVLAMFDSTAMVEKAKVDVRMRNGQVRLRVEMKVSDADVKKTEDVAEAEVEAEHGPRGSRIAREPAAPGGQR